MISGPPDRRSALPEDEKHYRAVRNTLSWADESAARGDYADAIAWLDVITAIGDELPDLYAVKRASWRSALQPGGALEEAG